MTVKANFAFLDVSASNEPVAISHGYSFCTTKDNGVVVAIDRQHLMAPVDQLAMFEAWVATERALHHLDDARTLMRTHPAFKDMA
jgi:hypothetical protein